MRQLPAAVIAAALAFGAAPARADQTLIPAGEARAGLKAALGKQIDVRFSESFAKGRLASPDIDGVIVYGLPPGKLCLFGQGKGLEASAPALSQFASPDGGGDVCVPLSDVSVRITPSPAPEGASPMPFYSTDRTACNWVWREGRDLGLWTETCKFDTGLWDVVYDAGTDRFALRVNAGEPYTVLQPFHEAGGATALLPGLKARGLVLDTADCVMAKVEDQPAPDGWTAWQVVPTGKLKQAFDAVVQTEVPDPPCGKLGYAADSVGFFMVSNDHPDRVVYANLGQDGTMIDLASIRLK
ncbi:hypothetical protein [Aestuariivirga sp.]|uniref:hypothetical protein n=1 Tax=Aestuariivirga sp. TaxID=2650926 RepID=UPI003BAAE594